MPENIHPHCAGPQHDRGGATGWPQIEVKVHELPYNPEWPARTVDAAVFCTYALNPGRSVNKLNDTVLRLGADSLGGVALHRAKLEQHCEEFVGRILDNAAVRV